MDPDSVHRCCSGQGKGCSMGWSRAPRVSARDHYNSKILARLAKSITREMEEVCYTRHIEGMAPQSSGRNLV